jgi:serine protease inhibitor
VNAIYFKGNWANKFDKNLTEEKPFHLSENNERKVQQTNCFFKFPFLGTNDEEEGQVPIL